MLRLPPQVRCFVIRAIVSLLSIAGLAGCASRSKDSTDSPVRIGYMPNVTHAQAVVGVARGDFAKAVAPSKLQSFAFNAGPTIIEAIYAGHLDMAYIGPSPTLNGFMNSRGEEIRVVAGSACNGVLVVGSRKRGITRLEQLGGGRIATPQLGNTQDISAKSYVVNELHRRLAETGGDTEVIPFMNPDIELLFQKNQLDGAWLPEPWGSRLVEKQLVNILAEEKDLWPGKRFALTNVIARRDFLEKHPNLVRSFLQAHVAITRELQQDASSFSVIMNSELKRLTGKTLPDKVMQGSLKHVLFDFSLDPGCFQTFFEKGRALGILRGERLDTEKLIYPKILDGITSET